MSQTLQFSLSSTAFNSSSLNLKKLKKVKPHGFQILCSPEHSSFKDDDNDDVNEGFVTKLFACFKGWFELIVFMY